LKLQNSLLILSFSVILVLAVCTNIGYGQQSKSLGIKITSPAKGLKIPAGTKNLTIAGTSNYNSTMSCQVSLIVDDVKPYQKTQPTGHNSTADYSSWKYDLTSQYTAIKEGTNKITAKLFCHHDATNVSKFYSVNVTGVASTSNQVSPNMSNTNRTANGTGKVGPLPQKQNITAESTLPKSAKHSAHALDVNGVLDVNNQQSQTDSTAAISENHRGHHPAKTIMENSKHAMFSSSDEKSLATRQNEENSTSIPVGNSTAPNSTNSITAPGVSTTTAGTVSIPTTTTNNNNNTAGTVSIPTTTTNNNNNTAGTVLEKRMAPRAGRQRARPLLFSHRLPPMSGTLLYLPLLLRSPARAVVLRNFPPLLMQGLIK